MPYEYPHHITNLANAFDGCQNLKYVNMPEDSFDRFQVYACGHMFNRCSALEYSNFALPAFIGNNDAKYIYKDCVNLSVDAATLFPKAGFFGRRLDMNGTFMGCVSLSGSVPGYMNDPDMFLMAAESNKAGVLTSSILTDFSDIVSMRWKTLPEIIGVLSDDSIQDYIGQDSGWSVKQVASLSAPGTIQDYENKILYRLASNDPATNAQKYEVYKRVTPIANESYMLSDFEYVTKLSAAFFLSAQRV